MLRRLAVRPAGSGNAPLPGRIHATVNSACVFLASCSREGTPTTHALPVMVPAAPRALPLNTVHLWHLDLTILPTPAAHLAHILSPGERQRADIFRFARDRERFIAVRGTLRRLLGVYLGRAPATLRIREGEYGKPCVDENGPAGMRLGFNVSHTEGLAVLAFSWDREIGVDVERVRSMPALDEIAGRFFAPSECVALAALPTHQRLHAFFACWTRKEAYLKAHGAGLTLPLDRFVVSVAPDEPARLLSVAGDPNAPSCWRLEALALGPGYAGALAVAGADWSLEACGDASHWPG